jgi:starvation-inducible DNA-binding protein
MDFRSSVDLSRDTREDLIELLNSLLASSVDLFTQVKQAHWNIKGRHFFARHELFDDLAKHVRKQSDELAERVATLGGYARGTARMAAEHTGLPEFAPDTVGGQDCVQALVDRFSTLASALRRGIERIGEELEDPATEDLLTQVLRQVELDMWFLESHLEDPQRAFKPAQEDVGTLQPS